MDQTEDFHDIPDTERSNHRDFVLRHIDFLTEVLTGEQANRQWQNPCGCPEATPEKVAHRREKNSGSFSCVYDRIEYPNGTECSCCGDPLTGSDDPLDTVAAVVLARQTGVANRYFDRQERILVRKLRDSIGSWEEIAARDTEVLHELCCEVTRVAKERVERLTRTLEQLQNHRWLDSLTLRGLPRVAYEDLHELFVELPGVDQQDAWWLVLAALDKPVWPADPDIDYLLVELGLLEPEALASEKTRHRELEDELTDRQILPLHRTLAAHSRYCGDNHRTASCEFRKFTLSFRNRRQKESDCDLKIADLFAGAGGLSHGFARAGCGVAFAVDQDLDATDTFRLNHPEVPHSKVLCQDIADVAASTDLLEQYTGDLDIIVGGPPCQALSVAGYRARLANVDEYSVLDDPRTTLYQDYVDIVDEIQPSVLVMENVEGILSEIGDTGVKVIDDVEEALSDVGYEVDHCLIDCSRHGVPQTRDRVVVLGIRREFVNHPDERLEMLFSALDSTASEEQITLKQALANLPRIGRGEGAAVAAGQSPGNPSTYIDENELSSGTRLTYNHRAREHSMEKDRILFDEALEPGDTGWDVKYGKDGEYSDLIEYNVGTEESPAFKDKYRMLEWNEPSPTIVAHLQKDSNSFILPDYYQHANRNRIREDDSRNRGISPREAARIQSFPDHYVFLGSFTSQFRQIGNAVPPLIGEQLGNIISDHLSSDEFSAVASCSRCQAASTDD